ncbi:DUF7284 family protein [Halomicrobium salinisoli]|uniref:DUF7284 family protein n=1 Tax=Halomicrobium salinisoli TaxID=2878391 RepID=UPI001CEFCDD8|nr:hypothetical protein [Halomicrobium salinisoli]
MRAISTVVDATVALLLIGGAVATLTAGPGAVADPSPRDHADEQARIVATSTAGVDYALTPDRSAEGVVVEVDDAPLRRTARGTLASLLARAAVANATVEGERLLPARRGYERAATGLVRNRTGGPSVRTAVRATWEPYRGAPLSGSVRAGPRPPADADVAAAALTVSSGVPAAEADARRAAESDGFDGVARAVSDAVVRGLFPPDETRLALRGDAPVDALAARRYRRTARLFGAGEPGVGERNATETNARLAASLADRFERDLRARYGSPDAAARNASTGRVRIVVRTWSP